jgi:cell division protein FtsL
MDWFTFEKRLYQALMVVLLVASINALYLLYLAADLFTAIMGLQ